MPCSNYPQILLLKKCVKISANVTGGRLPYLPFMD
jgi:hypothetical protein